MLRNRSGIEESSDRFGGEVDGWYLTIYYPGDGALTEWDEYNLARSETQIGAIGERSAVATVGFSRYYLKKHGYIIA